MLILRRKVGEKIVIGEGITVVVSRVSGGRVTLGIEAPSEVHIMRGELRPFDQTAPVAPQSVFSHGAAEAPLLPSTTNRLPR